MQRQVAMVLLLVLAVSLAACGTVEKRREELNTRAVSLFSEGLLWAKDLTLTPEQEAKKAKLIAEIKALYEDVRQEFGLKSILTDVLSQVISQLAGSAAGTVVGDK